MAPGRVGLGQTRHKWHGVPSGTRMVGTGDTVARGMRNSPSLNVGQSCLNVEKKEKK